MKQAILCYVMIITLLAAATGCTDDLVSQKETNQETVDVPTQPPVTVQEPADNGNPATTEGQEQNEPEPQGNENPETIPSEAVPPEAEPPKGEQPEEQNKPPTGEIQEEKPSIVEPPEVKPPVIENPEVNPPPVEPPEVKTPTEDPPEAENPVVEPPEVIPPIVPPNNVMLLINELRTEYSPTSKRAEYIEFKVTKAGNLNGISLHIMYDAVNPFIYYFPNVNVKKGEYITLHLRKLENNCVNELGEDLNLSGGIESCPTARDLWVEGTEKKYLHKTDIVYLQDASGNIIDAIVMNEKPSMTWNNSQSHFQAIVENLCKAGAWESEDGENPTAYDAVDTSSIGSNYMKSVCRYETRENHFNTTDWYVNNTTTTPGKPNN